MALSRENFLADVARALRARHGEAEGDALVRPLESWIDVGWPLPPGRGTEAPSPRAAVEAAELAVVDAFPDRAGDLLVRLARISAAAALAEAVTWDSVTTSPVVVEPFRRVDSLPTKFENVELGFHRSSREERRRLFDEITAERAASLVRRRVRLHAGTLDRGRLLLTRLLAIGTADVPFAAHWVELTAIPEDPAHDYLVSWLPQSHHAAVDAAIAPTAAHVWCDQAAARWDLQWRPGWVR